MTWIKAWRETRCRILWSLIAVVGAVWIHLYMTPKIVEDVAASPAEAATRLSRVMPVDGLPSGSFSEAEIAGILAMKVNRLTLVLLAPFVALMLAGSGINTQTGYAMRQGVHPSMIYTLSLPVSRRRLLGVRAGLGWVEMALIVAAMAAVPPATRFLTHGFFPWAYSFNVVAPVMLGTSVIYALVVLLATFLDELWHSVVSMTGVFDGRNRGHHGRQGYIQLHYGTNRFVGRRGRVRGVHHRPLGRRNLRDPAPGILIDLISATIVSCNIELLAAPASVSP